LQAAKLLEDPVAGGFRQPALRAAGAPAVHEGFATFGPVQVEPGLHGLSGNAEVVGGVFFGRAHAPASGVENQFDGS
jgi:hypothetical protein